MSKPYLAWVRDIDYRGNSPRHEILGPVERCEHGYLDEHQWYDTLCPGAGIGDNDE